MAFSVPNFNLVCDVWSGPWVGKFLRLHDLPCNLAMGRRVQPYLSEPFDAPNGQASPCLLVPKLSDIRDEFCGSQSDIVEVPRGSGRWYSVGLVDDVGKGFDNEYRLCSLRKVSGSVYPGNFPGLLWPIPIP
jgi:hypothetical protein